MFVGCLVFSGCSKVDLKAEADNLFVQGCDEFKVGYEKLVDEKIVYMPKTAKEYFRQAAAKNSEFENYYFSVSPIAESPRKTESYSQDDLKAFLKVMQKCDVVRAKVKQ